MRKPKRSKSNAGKLLLVIVIVGAFLAIGVSSVYFSSGRQSFGPLGSAHEHVDFKVYINGRVFNFSEPKYMLRAQHVHVEAGDGDVIHKHATGVTIGEFFRTIRWHFNSTCLVSDDGQSFCNGGEKSLKFYLNGKPNDSFANYELHNRDKILISYGPVTDAELPNQLRSITDKAKDL